MCLNSEKKKKGKYQNNKTNETSNLSCMEKIKWTKISQLSKNSNNKYKLCLEEVGVKTLSKCHVQQSVAPQRRVDVEEV